MRTAAPLTLDARRTVEKTLPVLAGLQMLGMQSAEAAVSTWVAEHLEASSVLRVCHMADRYQMTDLAEQARAFVDGHFAAVVAHEDWGIMTAEMVEELLSRDGLRPSGEINVFRALVRWAGACENTDARKASFEELLGRCVRVPLLDPDELAGDSSSDARTGSESSHARSVCFPGGAASSSRRSNGANGNKGVCAGWAQRHKTQPRGML